MHTASWTVRHPRAAVWLVAAAVGLAVFFVWIGYARTLDPTSLRWIWHEDPFQHVMGWEQFRNAPLLQYPITKNHLCGLEWSSTVVFTDSIPIAALVLRPFSALLPHPFQYLGWWVLLSLILQAYWAARLVLLRSDRLRDAAIGAVFFTTTPVLLERVGLHTALGSQWLLLWALWLYLSQRGPAHRWWTALLLLTVAVHAYLFAMIGLIWVAHLVACRRRGELTRRDLARAGATMLVVVAWMHALGYFMVRGGAAAGGVRTSFDLLGFIAPSYGARLGLVHSAYNVPWDGCTYLGAGMLALLVASAVAYLVRARRGAARRAPDGPSWWPLVVAVALLGAFAITNDVTFARRPVLHLPLPHLLAVLYATFRGAERMMWPAYYAIFVGTLWLALRAWPARARDWVLVAALGLQLVDLSGFAAIKRAETRGSGMTRPLQDPIWPVIAQHDRNLVSVPSKNRQVDWPTFAWFAARHRLGTDIGYLARANPAVGEAGERAHLDAVRTGHYDPHTVYYFPDAVLWDVARETMGPRDLAVVADGYDLILPGGTAWTTRPQPPAAPGVPELGRSIRFNTTGTAGLLIDGWSWTESWGTWGTSKDAELVLPVPPHEPVDVMITWISGRRGMVTIRVDGRSHAVWVPREGVTHTDTFRLTPTDPLVDVHLSVPWLPIRPNVREVSVGIVSARIEPASTTSGRTAG